MTFLLCSVLCKNACRNLLFCVCFHTHIHGRVRCHCIESFNIANVCVCLCDRRGKGVRYMCSCSLRSQSSCSRRSDGEKDKKFSYNIIRQMRFRTIHCFDFSGGVYYFLMILRSSQAICFCQLIKKGERTQKL
jgi:hypothetical protein